MSATENQGGEGAPLPADSDAEGITAATDEGPGGAVECTLYPTDAAESDLVTTWITAEEGAFVALDEVR